MNRGGAPSRAPSLSRGTPLTGRLPGVRSWRKGPARAPATCASHGSHQDAHPSPRARWWSQAATALALSAALFANDLCALAAHAQLSPETAPPRAQADFQLSSVFEDSLKSMTRRLDSQLESALGSVVDGVREQVGGPADSAQQQEARRVLEEAFDLINEVYSDERNTQFSKERYVRADAEYGGAMAALEALSSK